MPRVRVAVVQAAPVPFEVMPTLERIDQLTTDAANQGAQLVLFPEVFVSIYPRGLDFGATIGNRTGEGRAWFQRYLMSSISVPGPATEMLGEIARKTQTTLVVGVTEREGRTLYCTMVTLGPDGRLQGKHRKVMPTASERLIWGQGDGSTLGAIDTQVGRVGSAICWENYMPLYRTHLYAQGVQIYCAPTADARETWQSTIRHIALEGRCFVLSANQFTRRSDYPADYPAFTDHSPDQIVCRGGSAIVDPMGEYLAGPLYDASGILTADLDLDAIHRAAFDFDAVGHYARPDLFRLTVNTRPRPIVEVIRDQANE